MSQKQTRVLAVDDDRETTEWLQKLFESRGYEVRTANDARTSELLCEVWHPDVVLLDLVMPDVEGVNLLRRLKTHAPSRPVVIVSGEATVSRTVEAFAAGAATLMEKPVMPDQLVQVVEQLTRGNHEDDPIVRRRRDRRSGPDADAIAGDAPAVSDGQEGRANRRQRARRWRERDRERARRRRRARSQRSPCGHVDQGQLRGDSRGASRVGAVRPQPRRVHGRWRGAKRPVRDGRIAARFFSTRSARCRRDCRPSCCGCCRSTNSGRLAPPRRCAPTSG